VLSSVGGIFRIKDDSLSSTGDLKAGLIDEDGILVTIELRLENVGTLKFGAAGGVSCPGRDLRVESGRGDLEAEREVDLDAELASADGRRLI